MHTVGHLALDKMLYAWSHVSPSALVPVLLLYPLHRRVGVAFQLLFDQVVGQRSQLLDACHSYLLRAICRFYVLLNFIVNLTPQRISLLTPSSLITKFYNKINFSEGFQRQKVLKS